MTQTTIMKKKLILFLISALLVASTWAQQRTVRGKVLDNTGSPLSGATIAVRGARNSTVTDISGNFSITISPGATLQISMIGYANQEIRVQNEESISVTLQQQSTSLGEVVVTTALGQSRRKDKIGYSASSFRAEEINRTAPISPLDGLQGRIAGADISTVGGQPGSSGKVILRGYSSISGSNQALVVVDGVPITNARPGSYDPTGDYRTDPAFGNSLDFGNGLNDLNPGDIENITILKGAAATSLYGSRAASGVILITTKKGRAGKIKVDFSSSAVSSLVAKLPDFQNKWGQGWNGQHLKEENGSWGPLLDGEERLWGSEVDNSRLLKPFSAVKDNVRHFFDQGLELANNIAISGGTSNSNFYLSYGNVNSNGVLPGKADFYGRNTISARGQLSTDKFLASASLNYINRTGSNASTNDDEAGSSTFENIIQIPRDFSITDMKDYNNKFFNVDNYYSPYVANPYFSLAENGNKYTSDRFFGNVELGFNFSKNFNIRWRTGMDVTNARLKIWQAVERPQSGSWRGPNPTNYEGASYTAKVGSVAERSDYIRELNSDLFVNYNQDITRDLNISGFVGGNYNEVEDRNHSTRVVDLTIPGFYSVSNSPNAPVVLGVTSRRRLMAAFAQANLSYKDYLFLTLNARNDWSSTLPIDKNSFFYPGVNASVLLSRLLNLNNSPVSYLKVRGGIGKTGRDAPVYSLASILVNGNANLTWGNIVFPLNGVPSYSLGNIIGNNTLKPEITTEIELGTEMRFLKDIRNDQTDKLLMCPYLLLQDIIF
jgi:TonB-linked SusC/RagA family outer membrane protein